MAQADNTTFFSPPPGFNNSEVRLGLSVLIFNLYNRPIVLGIYLLLDMLAAVGQGLACAVYRSQCSVLSCPTTKIMFNQSLAGLVAVVLHALNFLVPTPLWLPPTLASQILCQVWLSRYPLDSVYAVVIFSPILSSLERYLATLHPVWHRAHFNDCHAKIGIASIWIFGCLCMIPVSVLATNRDPVSGFCQTNVNVGSIAFSFSFLLLPVTVNSFFYWRILWKLRTISKNKGVVHGAPYRQAKTNVTTTMFVMFVTYTVFYMPVFILIATWKSACFDDINPSERVLVDVVLILPVLAVLSNFAVCCYKNKRFSCALQKLLKSAMKRCRPKIGASDQPSARY